MSTRRRFISILNLSLWQNSFTCYSCSMNCCYKVLTALFSIPLALCWGCTFGITSFIHIWFCMPVLRCNHIVMKCVKTCMSILVSTFVGPYFEVMGLILTRIHVTWARNKPPRPYMEKLYSYECDDEYKKPFLPIQGYLNKRVQPAKKTYKSEPVKTTSSSEQFVTKREVEEVNDTYVRRSEPEYRTEQPAPSKYAYYYENEKQLQPVVATQPTRQPKQQQQQQQVQYYNDSFDQIPTHSSTFSDERMPNRSYKPRQPHYFEKTEAYKYKTVNSKNERYKNQYLTASDYYSGYTKPEPEPKKTHYTINTRPKWKL